LTYHQLLAIEIRLEEKKALNMAKEKMATKTVKIGQGVSDYLTFNAKAAPCVSLCF